ncbi:hypothetical protein Mpsy_2471 [Methanolobus psychrophilus R15]|nr:hypothetical protein Mpsy_2471 [Methanolobus psychrophilus R15]
MCFWVRFWEDENNKVLREVPVHAETTNEAKSIFQHDFPDVSHFELRTP